MVFTHVFDHVVDRYPALTRLLPFLNWLSPYARLMRLDKPIGTWLLLLPCWWGIVLAGPRWPKLGLMLLFGCGAVVMRSAGCVLNDMIDRKLDAQVERTKARPLASGEIALWQAGISLAGLLLIGLAILLTLNSVTIGLGIASLALVALYPLMKRVTWWPQLVLGLAFNWGALMGWAAVTGGMGLPAALLYLAGIGWTLGYDTIYAHQDMRDDEAVGIKSTARLFGERSKRMVALFYALAGIGLLLAGWAVQLGAVFYIGMAGAAVLTAWHLRAWQPYDPDDCLLRFRANRDIGLLVLVGLIAGKLL